ncbi:kinase-like domain-containing protein [Rhizophagus clarus]|uniref:Kinase-like domain-containing protein n=1 Tax=Rhizophagus clarus TaxID=94130 RepID=A0A8H3QF08_9GLOM|nr:kinase-like domain-containing protein [Rhizophagus clarus]
MDQFIFKNNLKWIPYNKFENIEYLDKSGFSTLYKATYKDIEVVLKCLNYLNDSDEILKKFLNEQKIIGNLYDIISIFGFTKNPNNLDYMLITEYANKGNLRGCLTEIANSWEQKLFMLYKIIKGLNDIHKENLIHHDFHDEKTAETYYQNSQNGLKEKQIELDALQQKNSQFEQDIQILKLTIAIQIKESAEIKNTLQTQIIHLQNEIYEKQAPASNLTEQLKQNKLISLEVQAHIDQLEHEKINLQEKLTQTETNIRELKFQQESLIEQKEQLENELNRSQDKCEQIEQKRIELYNMVRDLSIEQKLSTELKAKLEEEINQLEQKLNNKKQIKEQLVHALQIKKDKINELEQRLIILDNERIRKLKDKTNELSKIEKELINKLTSGENTKEVHKEKEAKEKELDELKKELSRTDTNRKKRVLEQINKFMESKSDFLSLREEVIKKLQNCCDRLESSIAVNNGDKYTKEFQNILVKYNDGMMTEDINSLRKNLDELKAELEQERKELKNLE